MEEIKSVRIRRKSATPDENLGLGDIKITLYKDFDKRTLTSIQSNGTQLWSSTEYSGTRYIDYTNDELIQDYIRVNAIFQSKAVDYYQIIQDPWLDTSPKWRNYGYDCYYLNNGSNLFINWNLNGTEIGGKSWSDDDGNELHIERGSTQSSKDSITKKVIIITPDNQKISLSTSGFTYNLDDFKHFNGAMSDLSIVNDVITTWKIKVPNYDLDLCSPNYISCNLQKYISPIDELKEEKFKSATQSNTKFKINVVLPNNLKVKVKEDLSNLKIYLGDIPSEFIFQDEVEFLDSEYIEGDFEGDDEQIDYLLNEGKYLGESGGEESDDFTQVYASQNAGGVGVKRFQKMKILNGEKIFNGEIADSYLAKLDFNNLRIEKNAAIKLNKLALEFENEFGIKLRLTDGYRTFNVQDRIFDWDYFNKYNKGRKKGTNGGVAASKPGTSLHGWGQAVDISGFGNGPGNKYFDWFDVNAKKYGWVNPSWAKQKGAGYEPWHWEYIGSDLFKG